MFFITLGVIEFLATTTLEIQVVANMWDKTNHLSAFFVLYILLSFAFKSLSKVQKIIFLLSFGVQIEIIQIFIDGRDFSLYDIFADSVGIALAVLFSYLPILKRISESFKKPISGL